MKTCLPVVALSVLLLGCAKQIDRPDASVPRDRPVSTESGILGINPTVDSSVDNLKQLDEALQKSTFVYASTHRVFPEPLLVQYREQSQEAEVGLMVLDDGGWVDQVQLGSKDIVACDDASLNVEKDSGVEADSVSFQSYADVMASEGEGAHLVLYEINAGQVGAEKVPNFVEIIFDGDGQKFFPMMFRLTDSRLGKAVCFSLLRL